jgi:hypothetical protein
MDKIRKRGAYLMVVGIALVLLSFDVGLFRYPIYNFGLFLVGFFFLLFGYGLTRPLSPKARMKPVKPSRGEEWSSDSDDVEDSDDAEDLDDYFSDVTSKTEKWSWGGGGYVTTISGTKYGYTCGFGDTPEESQEKAQRIYEYDKKKFYEMYRKSKK